MDVTIFYPYSTRSFLIPVNYLRKLGRKKKTQLLGSYIKWRQAGHPGAKCEEALAFGAQPSAHTPESQCPLGFVRWRLASRSLVLAMLKQHTFLPVSEHRSARPCLLEARRCWAGRCLGPASGRGSVPGSRPRAGPGGDFVPLCPVGSEGSPGTLKRGFLSSGSRFLHDAKQCAHSSRGTCVHIPPRRPAQPPSAEELTWSC